MTPPAGELQMEEDMGVQQVMWRVERVGWALMAVVVLAALVGVFGPGPFSHERVSSGDGRLVVDYLRFNRSGGTTELTVQVDAALARDGQVNLVFNQPYLDSVQVEAITPAPAEEVAGRDGVRFSIPTEVRNGALSASFELRPEAIGTVDGSIDAGDGASVAFTQFFYP